MSKGASPGVIGAFVVGATVVLVVSILVFGSGRFFEKSERFVIYFEDSVTGLSIGAPVVLRGVEVGSVVDIRAVIDSKTIEVSVPVFVTISSDRVDLIGPSRGTIAGVHQLVEKGQRAQLAMQSLVTGKLYVNLVNKPEKPAVYRSKGPGVPEIPSVEGELKEVAKKLSDLPIKELTDRLLSAVEGVDTLVNGPELRDAITHLNEALTEARDLMKSANDAQIVADADTAVGHADEALTEARDLIKSANDVGIVPDADSALEQLSASLKAAESAMVSVDRVLTPGSPLHYELLQTLRELQRASRGVATVTEQLAREPESVIRGRR